MGEYIKGTTRGGKEWIPNFVLALNKDECIGCGRCYKVCGRSVLNLNMPDEEEEEEDDYARFMEIISQEDCIGCEACGMVCPKKCYTYAHAKLN